MSASDAPPSLLGFVALTDGSTADLYVEQAHEPIPSRGESDREEVKNSSGSLAGVVYTGSMASLESLLALNEVAFAVLDYSTVENLTPRPSGDSLSFVEVVTNHVEAELNHIAERYRERGRSLEDLGSPSIVAARMAASIPAPSRWDDIVGPFLTQAELLTVLRLATPDEIEQLVASHSVLSLMTADGHEVFPLFQFGPSFETMDGLREVLSVVTTGPVSAWTIAGWLVSPAEPLEGVSPMDWLKSERDTHVLLALAADFAERFAQ